MIGTISQQQREREQQLPSEEYIRKAMPQDVKTFGMTMIFLMVVFFINNPVGTSGAGGAAFLYWIIGALVFFVPCMIVTAQLGSIFFHEGSIYNWTQKALGNFWSFFASVSFWVSGILGMVGSAAIAVSILQATKSNWLAEPREQGVLIVFILILSAIMAMQRFSIVQHLVNVSAILMLCVVALLGLAIPLWLLAGHPSATSFASSSTIQPGNYVLFSTVILAFLGASVPMVLGGEIADQKVVSRHLVRGGALVMGSYIIVTLALIVVVGPRATAAGPFAIIAIIDQVFGRFVGNLAIVCIVLYFLVLTALLNSIFARFLLVGALDRRIPVGLGRLDENRVPLTAIVFQTTVVVLFAAIVFLLPYLISFTNPVNLTNELFTLTLYAHSIIWAIASSFLFIDLLALYLRYRGKFRALAILPMPVLWVCIIVAPVACLLAIIDTLAYSPIPQLIPSTQWGFIVGGLTVGWLVFAWTLSMVASSEASWEDLSVPE